MSISQPSGNQPEPFDRPRFILVRIASPIFVGIVGTFLLSISRNGLDISSVTAGLVLSTLTLLAEVFVYLTTLRQEYFHRVTESENTYLDKLRQSENDHMQALEFDKRVYSNPDLFELMKRIEAIDKKASLQPLQNEIFKSSSDRLFRETERWLSGKHYYDFEFDRIRMLAEAVEHAEKYIKAVNHDATDYMEGLWTNLVGEKYLDANIKAANRNIPITRLFIVPRSVADGSDTVKTKIFHDIILQQNKPSIIIKIIVREDLPPRFEQKHYSFLIIDDCFGSASPVDPGDHKPSFITTDAKEIRELNLLFEELERHAHPLSDFPSLTI